MDGWQYVNLNLSNRLTFIVRNNVQSFCRGHGALLELVGGPLHEIIIVRLRLMPGMVRHTNCEII